MLFTALILICVANAQQEKVVSPADIANLKQVGAPQISPDGKLAVYVVTTPVAAGAHKNAHIWITATDQPGGSRPFALSAGADTDPRWAPDGKSIAFLSDRKNPLAEPATSSFKFSLAGVDDRARDTALVATAVRGRSGAAHLHSRRDQELSLVT